MLSVMIVDDENTAQEILAKYISSHLTGYYVRHICSNGAEALRCYMSEPVDIVLVDIHMPLMNGITLIEKLNEISSNYVPIIISGYADFGYAKSAMKLGVTHYLLKPLDFKELERSLQAASHTLETKRQLQASLNWTEENQEIFFTQLISGEYPTREQAQTYFNGLHLPFDYDSTCGFILQATIETDRETTNETDAIFSQVKQFLQEYCFTQHVFQVTMSNLSCTFLVINSFTNAPLENIVADLEKLHIENTSVNFVRIFTSLEEIRIGEPILEAPIVHDSLSNTHIQVIEPSIKRAIDYMNAHYAEDLTREMVAEKVYMSGAHFSRCFKMVMNISYKDYLTEIRMQKAIELLNTSSRIQDIAKQVGYPNTNRFNINFKNYTSYTPSEYRRDVLKNHVD